MFKNERENERRDSLQAPNFWNEHLVDRTLLVDPTTPFIDLIFCVAVLSFSVSETHKPKTRGQKKKRRIRKPMQCKFETPIEQQCKNQEKESKREGNSNDQNIRATVHEHSAHMADPISLGWACKGETKSVMIIVVAFGLCFKRKKRTRELFGSSPGGLNPIYSSHYFCRRT